ncbi:hypothetical protein CDIK_4203 [Cucumispora dikerogammari]|nr:hypothetical protein CDIK_4203 [Cucumispora dikerogammari]
MQEKISRAPCERSRYTLNDYPIYWRRDLTLVVHDGQSFINLFVVLYNKEMCRIYGSLINVEICNTLGTIKYLNKYITKGFDSTDVMINGNVDEVKRYLGSRYVSAMEAA